MNFTGNLQAADNSGASRTDVTLKPDVAGLSSLGIAQASTNAGALTSTANSAFTRGTGAGAGFYYGGATGSLVGANTISSTGAFTGTLLALTADSTTTGTILGISGQGLISGKAIDVSLGTAYNLTGNDSANQAAGAVNIRAGAYNGNIFNVLSTASAGATTMNLANLQSAQIDGQLLKLKTTGSYAGSAGTGILNIDANTATGGTIARISGTSLTGASQALSIALGTSSSATAILATTGSSFTGNLIDLQVNGASQFKVDATTTTVAGGLVVGGNVLGSNGVSFSIDETGAHPINIGTTTASQINIARSGVLTNVGGTLTAASTLTVVGTTPASALVVSGTGAVAAQGAGTFGPTAGNQLVVQGAATGSPAQLSATGVADANITLQLTPKGTGTVQINGTGGIAGPASAALIIDATGAQNINIGGTNGTTLNLGRTGQLQALLGNATVGGTLGVTGNFSVNSTMFTVTAATGATAFAGDLNINSGKFTVAAATGNTLIGGTLTGSGATGFAIDSSVNQPLTLGTAATTTAVTISRAGQTTTVAGLLTVTGNSTHNGSSTFNGTVQVGAAGTALNVIRTGTCSIVATAVPALTTTKTNCPVAQDLSAFTVTIVPTSTPAATLLWNVDTSVNPNIVIRWSTITGVAGNTGALTFRWFAVR